MKKCKHCQTEIDAKAKICPNCRKKQGMPIWLIVILAIIGITLVSSIAGGESSSSDNPTGTTNNTEKISLLDGYTVVLKVSILMKLLVHLKIILIEIILMYKSNFMFMIQKVIC